MTEPNPQAICVDAACKHTTQDMEYRGMWVGTRAEVFKQGPFVGGTNNIGEFLAVVHALALLKNENDPSPVYTDSTTAIAWIRKKEVNSKVQQEGRTGKKINELLARATKWLCQNDHNEVLKWDTKRWGEIPADFGRKM